MKDIMQITEQDNIVLALRKLAKEEKIVVNGSEIVIKQEVDRGHKVALKDLKKVTM